MIKEKDLLQQKQYLEGLLNIKAFEFLLNKVKLSIELQNQIEKASNELAADLTATVNMDDVSIAQSKQFIVEKIQGELKKWQT